LFIPGSRGLLGRLRPEGAPFTLRAAAATGDPTRAWPLAYTVERAGTSFVNPTLVLRPGERVRVTFDNALTEDTIVPWHGLAIDSRNDGGGMILAPAGGRFAYDFEVRNRAGLYWYHPHPHGLTAGQAYRGLFGLIEIEDPDDAALRAALDLAPGRSEIPLILQDRRAGNGYAASAADQTHGFIGDQVLIMGRLAPTSTSPRASYRFLRAECLQCAHVPPGLRTAAGKTVPFTLIGTDGGPLAAPHDPVREAFVSTAERLDILVDLSDGRRRHGLSRTRAFDPMHMEMTAAAGDTAGAVDHAAMGHAMPAPDAAAQPAPAVDHAAMGHGSAFPEARRGRCRIARARAHELSREDSDTAVHARRDRRRGRHRASATARLLAKGRWRINDRACSSWAKRRSR
jgi:FtsP/CotA-like multicopper oxidase with cupredoxin domain